MGYPSDDKAFALLERFRKFLKHISLIEFPDDVELDGNGSTRREYNDLYREVDEFTAP